MSRHRPSWAVILRASALAFVRVGVGVASAFAPVAAGGGGSCCAVLLLLEGGAADRVANGALKILDSDGAAIRAADNAHSGWRRASARSAWRLASAAIMTQCTCRVDGPRSSSHWGCRVHDVPRVFHGCSTTPGHATMFHECRANTRGTLVEH